MVLATTSRYSILYSYNNNSTYMIVMSSCLAKFFNSISHFTVIGVCKPDRRSARISFLRKIKKEKLKDNKRLSHVKQPNTYRDVTNNFKLSTGRADKLAYHLINGGSVYLETVMVLGERRLQHLDFLFQHIQAGHYWPSIDPTDYVDRPRALTDTHTQTHNVVQSTRSYGLLTNG